MAEVAGLEHEKVHQLVFESDLQTRYESGHITSQEFYDEFVAMTDTNPDIATLLNAGSDIFWLNYRIMPIISQLRSANFPMGILSNTCEAHWNFVCNKFPTIQKYFPNRVLSYEQKSMKPDGGIYEAAIELAKLPAEQIFFVDDRQENVRGALDQGMDAKLFTSPSELYHQLTSRGVEINL